MGARVGYADVANKIPMTVTTMLQAGPVSESVSTLAILQQVEAGKLALDRPIDDELTSWKLPPNELTPPVTLRMLLAHSAGLSAHDGAIGYEPDAAIPSLVQILDGEPPAKTPAVRIVAAPGYTHESDGGISIAQLALTDTLHQPFPDIVAKQVLEPFGMQHSAFRQPPPQAAAIGYRAGEEIAGKRHIYPEVAADGLWTTPTDLARYFAELALARTGRSKLVAKAIAQQMTTVASRARRSGLGLFVGTRDRTRVFGNRGNSDGFAAYAIASATGGYGIVMMMNGERDQLFEELLDAVAVEYNWPIADRVYVRQPLDPATRSAFVGFHQIAGDPLWPFEIADGPSGLVLRLPFEEPHELVPVGTDQLVDRVTGNLLRLAGDHQIDFTYRSGASAGRLPAIAKPMLFLLQDGDFDGAVERFAATRPTPDEVDRLNDRAFAMIRRYPRAAVSMLRLAATAAPASANVEDSLGTAYEALRDDANAIIAFQQSLALLDADPAISDTMRAAVRAHATGELTKLRHD